MVKSFVSGRRGLTLIELLLILTLMGSMVFMLPIGQELRVRAELKMASRRLVSELRWMQVTAILNNRSYRLYLSPEGSYQIRLEDQVVRSGSFPSQLRLFIRKSNQMVELEDELVLGFTGLGNSSFARTIGFQDGEERMIKVVVSTWMGRIRIDESW